MHELLGNGFQSSRRALGCRIDGVCGAGDSPLPDLPRETSRNRSAPEKSVQFGLGEVLADVVLDALRPCELAENDVNERTPARAGPFELRRRYSSQRLRRLEG